MGFIYTLYLSDVGVTPELGDANSHLSVGSSLLVFQCSAGVATRNFALQEVVATGSVGK